MKAWPAARGIRHEVPGNPLRVRGLLLRTEVSKAWDQELLAESRRRRWAPFAPSISSRKQSLLQKGSKGARQVAAQHDRQLAEGSKGAHCQVVLRGRLPRDRRRSVAEEARKVARGAWQLAEQSLNSGLALKFKSKFRLPRKV